MTFWASAPKINVLSPLVLGSNYKDNSIVRPTCGCVCPRGSLCWSGGEGRGLNAVLLDSSEETWPTTQEAESHT